MATRTLSPESRNRLASLKFEARKAVEGAYAGMHASPHHGASIEFTEHKEYVPGDDVRSIDWNVTARMGRSGLFVQSAGAVHCRATSPEWLCDSEPLWAGVAVCLSFNESQNSLKRLSSLSIRSLGPSILTNTPLSFTARIKPTILKSG